MSFTLLILDGPDGSGKSHHTRRLAVALRERGVDAVPFHHARPATGDPILAALDYAAQRRRLMVAPPASVVVCDRWWTSTRHLALVLARPELRALVDWERDTRLAMPIELRPRMHKAHLDASDDVLDARISARGTPVSGLDRAMRDRHRAEAEDAAESSRFCTGGDAAVVASALLAWALEALALAGVHRG